MQQFKNIWPYINIAAAVSFVGFLVACNQHDSGIPHEPTPAQHELAAELAEECIQLLDSIADALDHFTESPDNEVTGANALIAAYEQTSRFMERNRDEVCLWIGYPDSESDRERISQVARRLDESAEAMAKEVLRRRGDPAFEVNQPLYDKVCATINKGFPEPSEKFCDTSTCFWCKWKHYFYLDQ